MALAKLKTPDEMKRVREADAIIVQQRRTAFVPEKSVTKALAFFELSRYTAGPFRGLFVVTALSSAHPKAQRQTIADGVDMVVAMSSLETALRRRVFK